MGEGVGGLGFWVGDEVGRVVRKLKQGALSYQLGKVIDIQEKEKGREHGALRHTLFYVEGG